MKNTKEPAAIKPCIKSKHNQVNISLALSALTLMLLGMSRPAGAETLYSLTDLGSIPNSFAYGINNSGQVIVTELIFGLSSKGFRAAPNSLINQAMDLGTLGGSSSVANGINKAGQVVGQSNTASGQDHAYRTAANTILTLVYYR